MSTTPPYPRPWTTDTDATGQAIIRDATGALVGREAIPLIVAAVNDGKDDLSRAERAEARLAEAERLLRAIAADRSAYQWHVALLAYFDGPAGRQTADPAAGKG